MNLLYSTILVSYVYIMEARVSDSLHGRSRVEDFSVVIAEFLIVRCGLYGAGSKFREGSFGNGEVPVYIKGSITLYR